VKLFSKNSNLCDHNSPTLQTDGRTDRQTDRQTTCDRNTALCTKVHRAVMKQATTITPHTLNRTKSCDDRNVCRFYHTKNTSPRIFFIRSAHKTLGEINSKHAWQFLTTSILPVLKSFMKNLLTVKSNEESSDLFRAHASRPYNKICIYSQPIVGLPLQKRYLQFSRKLHLLRLRTVAGCRYRPSLVTTRVCETSSLYISALFTQINTTLLQLTLY